MVQVFFVPKFGGTINFTLFFPGWISSADGGWDAAAAPPAPAPLPVPDAAPSSGAGGWDS